MTENQKLREALQDMIDMMDSGDESGAGSPWYLKAKAALATTEPAVNQQLTTDPFDEREAFEATVLKDNHHAVLTKRRNGCYQDDELQSMWWAWQARAALAARKPLSAVVLGESMSATFPGSNESSDGWFHQPDDPLQLAASLRRIAKEREQEFNSTFYFGYVADMLETCPHCHGSGLDEETFEACTKCNGTGKRDGLEVKT